MAQTEVLLNHPNFLASEVGLRTITYTFSKSKGTLENGRQIIPAGTIYPANDGTAVGIVFQDVDVTDGDAVAALMVGGVYLADKLSATVAEAAKAVFVAKGLFEQESPSVVLPSDGLLG